MKIDAELTRIEFNTIIAALRYWQRGLKIDQEDEDSDFLICEYEDLLLDGLSGNDRYSILDSNQVGELIEMIN